MNPTQDLKDPPNKEKSMDTDLEVSRMVSEGGHDVPTSEAVTTPCPPVSPQDDTLKPSGEEKVDP